MQYLGIDVHSRASVWCVVDTKGAIIQGGKTETSVTALQSLVRRWRADGELVCAPGMGTHAYLVHDAISATGTKIVSFSPNHLRVIAASRKKSDRRDAYWLARTLQTGLMPKPVYIPPPDIRALRRLLHRRQQLLADRKRWYSRCRATLRAEGHWTSNGRARFTELIEGILESPEGLAGEIVESIELGQEFIDKLDREIAELDGVIDRAVRDNEVVKRLQTIPGVGRVIATTLYATVGDIRALLTV